MEVTTTFGRQKEAWEIYPDEFCDRGNIARDSMMAKAIYALSNDEFRDLVAVVDPSEDNLIHVDSGSFSVNHGNVGSQGIRYDF